MGLASRQTLIGCLATLAALVVLAATASAETVEIVDEASGTHCNDVTLGSNHAVSGGCPIHFLTESPMQAFKHGLGGEVMTSSCTSGFTARFDEDGLGYATSQAHVGGGCSIVACDEAAPSHANLEWSLALVETGGDTLTLLMTFCVRPIAQAEGQGTSCTLLMPATQSGHGLEFSADEAPCFEDPTNELSVHWVSDTVFDAAEVVHTP